MLEKDRGLTVDLKKLRAEYYAHLDKVCVKDEVYEGLRNAFHYVVCPLDPQVLNYQLELNRIYFLWDDATYNEKRRELDKNKSKETQVFLSFYTPDVKLDDLSAKNSNWRSFIDSNGKRYLASIQKMKNRFEDLRVLYPAHSPWSTGYTLTFPVALDQVDFTQADFTLTGRVGYSKKSFTK
jgi:predicted phosphoadenosine phosphosulfate sulfurtransferase